MLSQEENKHKCVLCNNINFYKQDGYFFCSTCHTQNEDFREEIFEERYDTTTRLRKTKIKTAKLDKIDIIGWTSWELYNFVLIGLANQLIEIGVNPKVKLTILQLWTQYLSKLEVAFTSKRKKCIPKIARRYHKKDVDIIYGKIEKKKKKRQKKRSSRISGSSIISSSYVSNESVSTRELNKSKKLLVTAEYEKYIQSQLSSDNDESSSLNYSLQSLKSNITQPTSNNFKIRFNKNAKLEDKKIKEMSKNIPCTKRSSYKRKHVTTQYAMGPDVVTPIKLLSIVYLALRINNSNIYISDILRFSREGHLSYYKMDHLIPPEVILTKGDINFLTPTTDITHKGLRRTAATIAKFLNVHKLADVDFITLIKRYCNDLELPRGISLYAERIFLLSPSIMKFTSKSALIPNYEGRAIAYIIVILKVLFSLDDITEKEISRVVDKINSLGSEKGILTARLFNFCEWQKYIECRKRILINLHFPSKIKYDPECIGTTHLYLRFMGLMKSKRETEPLETTDYQYFISPHLANAFQHCIDKLNDNLKPLKEMEIFSPSFTPLQSYIRQLKENLYYEIPSILRINFYETKVGYMTKPNSLIELAAQCEIKLKVVDCSIQFLEKIVPPFEQLRILSLEKLSKIVKVESSKTSNNNHNVKKTENLLDYSHRNRVCKLNINFKSFEHYSLIYDKFPEFNETLDLEENSFFNQILSDGRLNIHDSSDSEDESILNKSNTKDNVWTNNISLLNKEFSKKYNIQLYSHEIQSLSNSQKQLKEKYIPHRDASGKFVKSIENRRKSVKIHKKKETKTVLNSYSYEPNEINVIFENCIKKMKCKNTNKSVFDDDVQEIFEDNINLLDSDISILVNDDDNKKEYLHNSLVKDCEILFRPYKDYWMYHCIFSRVKQKNFELFEKELPINFLWLLTECADIVEMTPEDLYEEICLIEAYHFNILKCNEFQDNDSNYEFYDYKSKSYLNNILNKW